MNKILGFRFITKSQIHSCGNRFSNQSNALLINPSDIEEIYE